MKKEYNGELLLCPCPTVLVTSKHEELENVLTVSWTGIASSHPEFVTISINPKRYSHHIIKSSNKFCINIPNDNIIKEVDYCGSITGKNANKFEECGFNKIYYGNDYIVIDQCPISLICETHQIIELGSHDLFIAKVIKKLINQSTQNIHNEVSPIVYFRPNYYRIDKNTIGYYGFSRND